MMGLLEIIMGAGEALKGAGDGGLGGMIKDSELVKGADELGNSFNDSSANQFFNKGMFEGGQFGGESAGGGSHHMMGFEQQHAQPQDAGANMQNVMSAAGIANQSANMLQGGVAPAQTTYDLPQMNAPQQSAPQTNPYLDELDKFDEIEAEKNRQLQNQGALYQAPAFDLSKPTTLVG
jgi:hypothetical protein